MGSKLLKSSMSDRRFWKVVGKGHTLFDSIGYSGLTSDEIVRFLVTYTHIFYKMMNVSQVLEYLNHSLDTELLNMKNKREDDSTVERFIHGLFYDLGKEGIEDVSIDMNNIMSYITSKEDIKKLIKRYDTGDIWDIACAYSFQKIEEDDKEVLMGTEEFDVRFKSYIDTFFSLLDKEISKESKSPEGSSTGL